MPETQETTLSDMMAPPSHTWTGFARARKAGGEQGSRKAVAPTTHYKRGGVRDGTRPRPLDVAAYLEGEEGGGGDADPAVQRVEVGDALDVVEPEDGAEPPHGEEEGEEHQAGVQQLPRPLVPPPGERDAVQHRPWAQKQVT